MARRFRGFVGGAVVAVLAMIASAGLTAGGGAPAGATTALPPPLGGNQSTSVNVETSCGPIPITLTVPKLVRARGAFALSATNVQVADIGLALTNTSPGTVDVPLRATPQTTQVVANGNAGQVITVSVIRAVEFFPYTVIPPEGGPITLYNRVNCTPVAPTTLASIRIIGGTSSPTVAHVDFGAAWECGVDSYIAGVGNEPQSFDVPTQVAHGATFSIPAISGPSDLGGEAYFFASADGATATPPFRGFGEIGAASVLTVTAPPGGVVTIRQNVLFTAGVGGGFCDTVGSGVLATIPVT